MAGSCVRCRAAACVDFLMAMLVVFVALVGSPSSRAGDAYAYRYDGPLVPGAETRDFKVVASGPTQLGDAAEVSTSARFEALGTSTTSSRSFVATETGMRGAGDGYAGRVLEGGRPDGQTVFAGHGEYRYGAGTTIVPEGTSVNVYAPHGRGIPDSLGGAIETGGPVSPYRVYGPGQQIPNYTLKTPDGLTVYSGSTTVQSSTNLSELLQPGMGTCHWAACVNVR